MDTAHDLIDTRNKEREYQANTASTDRSIEHPTEQSDEITAEIVWDSARKAGVVDDREIALIRATRLHDIPIEQVAALVGMQPEAANTKLCERCSDSIA